MTTPYYSGYTGAQVDAALASLLALDPSYDGVWDLGSGEEGGSVTGLALPFTPTKIQLTMEVPVGGDLIHPVLVQGTLSADGFTFQLNSPTTDTSYRLHYSLKGDAPTTSS